MAKIYLKNMSTKKEVALTSLPEEIHFQKGSQWITYNLISGQEKKIHIGNAVSEVAWDGIFFGKSRKNEPYMNKEYKSPIDWKKLLNKWKRAGVKINLRIPLMHHNTMVKIDTFDLELGEGSGYGDIHYSIAFYHYSDVSIETTGSRQKSTGSKSKSKRSHTASEELANGNGSKYEIKKGDTLWRLAYKNYNSGSKYIKIYNANKKVIESAAKKHGKASSENGHWIFPGTVIYIPAA